jgi:hypothetical protein
MRFDDWNLRKNNSDQPLKKTRNGAKNGFKINSNERPNRVTSVIVRSPRESTPARNETDDLEWRVVDGISIPEGPLSAAQCFRLVEGCASANTMLEVLLLKWQSDGAYLKTAVNIIKGYSKILNIARPTCNNDNIFHMIDEAVDFKEKICLTRACLRADVEYRYRWFNEELPDWVKSWRLAMNNLWENSKEDLRKPCFSPEIMGKCFLSCALLIVAEEWLEFWQENILGLLEQCDHLEFLTDEDSRMWRRRYLEILDDEDCATFDNPELLRFAMTISKWDKDEAALAVSKNQLNASSEMSSPQPSNPDAESDGIETIGTIGQSTLK